MGSKAGRPPSLNPMSEKLHIRVTPEEKEKIMEFSRESGISLLELVRIGIETAKKRK